MRTKYRFVIELPTVKAKSTEEAMDKILDLLDYYAGSNDGSELLANAEPILVTDKIAQEIG